MDQPESEQFCSDIVTAPLILFWSSGLVAHEPFEVNLRTASLISPCSSGRSVGQLPFAICSVGLEQPTCGGDRLRPHLGRGLVLEMGSSGLARQCGEGFSAALQNVSNG